MNVIICGSRSIEKDKQPFIEETCLNIISKEQYRLEIATSSITILSGNNPKGADWFGERFAEKYKVPLKLFPAEWNNEKPRRPEGWDSQKPIFVSKPSFYGTYNALAGFLRNQEMANHAYNNGGGLCIAFDAEEGNKKTGTKDMITRAKKVWLKVFHIKCFDLNNVKLKIYNEGLQRE